MALTVQQQRQVSALWADVNFVQANAVANFHLGDLNAAAAAIDSAFDTTLNAAVIAVGGGLTVTQAMAAVIPAPFNGATAAQKTLLCCYVLMKRAGII
jgi:hypothetical protein